MTNKLQRQVKGVLGEKLGMTQVWDAAGKLVPVTVVQAGPCVVTQVRGGSDGYGRRPAGLRRHRPPQGEQASRRATLRRPG